jgi:hypothetical protein
VRVGRLPGIFAVLVIMVSAGQSGRRRFPSVHPRSQFGVGVRPGTYLRTLWAPESVSDARAPTPPAAAGRWEDGYP